MAAKKSKALELDLIDELLNEDAAEIEINDDKAEHQQIEIEHSAEASAPLFDNIDPVEEAPVDHVDDKTIRLDHETNYGQPESATTQPTPTQVNASPFKGDAEDRVRASVGRFGALRSGVGQGSVTEAALAQSESLRIAQSRLLELEQEIERLRLQNEELAAAGETLRRRSDELLAQNQNRESDYQNALETFEQEKHLLTAAKEAVQRDMESLRRKNEELELRVTTNIQKIRVRERELENRLELIKMESAAIIRSKDEMVLELKRNIDQLNLELNNYRNKNQELNRQTTDKQEMLRRTVKALRLALSMLEGEEDQAGARPQKKAK